MHKLHARPLTLLAALLLHAAQAIAVTASAAHFELGPSADLFTDPARNGGTWLTSWPHKGALIGEPLNAVVSRRQEGSRLAFSPHIKSSPKLLPPPLLIFYPSLLAPCAWGSRWSLVLVQAVTQGEGRMSLRGSDCQSRTSRTG